MLVGPFRYRGASYYVRQRYHSAPAGSTVVSISEALECLRAMRNERGFRSRLQALSAERRSGLMDNDPFVMIALAIQEGTVQVDRRAHVALPFVVTEKIAKNESREPEHEDKRDWIEIELSDTEGNLIEHADVEIELPDGSTRKGRTDSRGRLFLGGIDPGQCKVVFVALPAVEQSPQFARATG